MTHEQIRRRDRYYYGAIPKGMQMHHLWYSEEYDPSSFVIITPEEHSAIHGHPVNACSEGLSEKERSKKYYYNNIERKKEYWKKYYEENREEIISKKKDYCRKYNEEHRKERCEYTKEYYKEHSEERKEYNKKYREKNKEELNRKAREKYRIMKHREKLIKLGII